MSAGTSKPPEATSRDRTSWIAERVERAKSGERTALDELVRELNPLLWQVARAEGLRTEDAADVVQTVWLELLRRLEEIRSPRALTGWLVTATRREAWRVLRRSRRQATIDPGALGAVADSGPEPDAGLLADERDRALWRNFRRLSEQCRRLLAIVAQVQRPDYAVISEALEMPKGSIGPTRGRCLAKLREMLAADPDWGAS